LQWVVRKSGREQLLVLHHNTPVGGHLGHDKLFFQLLLRDYWWPTLYKDVEQWVKSCKMCQEHSNLHGPIAARQQLIKTTQVLEKMGMDLIGLLPKSKEGHVYLLMQDYFTKWPKAIPLKDVTAKSVAGALLLVISMWGPPAELLSNQGPDFVVKLIHKLLRQWGIKRQCATAYHPQTNGQVEQFNRMLKAMIAKFVNGRQDNWDIYLPAFLYPYRRSPTTQVYGAHSLQSNAGQGTTKQGWSGNRVNSDEQVGAGTVRSTGGGQEAHFGQH